MNIKLPEIVAIGYYNTDVTVKNKTITKIRKTTMFEIELPDTDGGVSYIDFETHNISSDMIICARPGQNRRTHLPYRCYFIHMVIEDDLLQDMLTVPSFFKPAKMEPYRKLFKKLYKYYENSTQKDDVILQSLVLELIYKLNNDAKLQTSTKFDKGGNYEVINSVISYISDNLHDNLSLEIVANHVGFSPIYFHNLFKSSTGLTLHQYVEDLRIKKASTLLATTTMSLAEIAFECGFSSQSYFNYAFKRKKKMTPREYTKLSNNRYMLNKS